MNAVFDAVMHSLEWGAGLSGLTYAEVNIIVYFMLLPVALAAMADRILHWHWLKLSVLAVWATALLAIPNFTAFSDRAFDLCAAFLSAFAVVGLSYVQASVAVCVILPLLVLAGLVVFNLRNARYGKAN